jgi:hypothetical protein
MGPTELRQDWSVVLYFLTFTLIAPRHQVSWMLGLRPSFFFSDLTRTSGIRRIHLTVTL